MDRTLPRPGDVVAGKYEIERIAGEGGMGVVYAARHVVFNQRVALKVLFAETAARDSAVERFAREVQAAARIKSAHVAHVMDAGAIENGLPFLAMEFLEGENLEQLLERKARLPMEDVASYILQALEAVGLAHAQGIIHRDLKPPNLFIAIQPDGSKILKILDFGISKTMKKADRNDKVLTNDGNILGSPAYMSPEQLRDPRLIDHRADIWSRGAVMYELITGVMPFDADGGIGEVFAAILEKDPIPPRARNPEVPEGLERVVLRCLQKSPDARFQSAYAFATELAPFAHESWRHIPLKLDTIVARESMRDLPTPGYGIEAVSFVRPDSRASVPGLGPLRPVAPSSPTLPEGSQPGFTVPTPEGKRPGRTRVIVAAVAVAVAGSLALGFLLLRQPPIQGAIRSAPPPAQDLTSEPISFSKPATTAPAPSDSVTEPAEVPAASADSGAPKVAGPQKKPLRPKFLHTPD